VKSIGQRETLPADAGPALLNDIASTLMNGNRQDRAKSVIRNTLKISKIYSDLNLKPFGPTLIFSTLILSILFASLSKIFCSWRIYGL
jgi:hypothetical protein